MLASALCAGAASGGADVVSASHNPYPDNGIKFFSGEGRKLSPEKEREIEDLLDRDITRPTGSGVGGVEVIADATRMYAAWVLRKLRPSAEGVKVLLDCANGAAY